MSAGERRFPMKVVRPTEALGPDGQLQGLPSTLYETFGSLDTLGSSEPEIGNQQQGITNYRVEMYGDPEKPLKLTDYLSLGSRKLHIQAIDDRLQNGQQLTLLCGERHDP